MASLSSGVMQSCACVWRLIGAPLSCIHMHFILLIVMLVLGIMVDHSFLNVFSIKGVYVSGAIVVLSLVPCLCASCFIVVYNDVSVVGVCMLWCHSRMSPASWSKRLWCYGLACLWYAICTLSLVYCRCMSQLLQLCVFLPSYLCAYEQSLRLPGLAMCSMTRRQRWSSCL